MYFATYSLLHHGMGADERSIVHCNKSFSCDKLRFPMIPVDSTPSAVDASVLARVAAGDKRAFEAIYDSFSAPLYSLALRMLGKPEEAEELIQEVFVKIWKDAGQYDSKRGVPLAWAITITRYRAIDRIRSQNRRSRLQDAAENEVKVQPFAKTSEPLKEAILQENAAAVQGAVHRLLPELRQVIDMAYFNGLTQSEIAAKLGEPLTTVKGRIRRAMISLRQSLKGNQ